VTHAVMLLGLILGVVLQAVSPRFALMGQATWPVLFGVVTYYALTRNRNLFLQAAVLAGLVQDALGMIPLGYSSFAFVAVGLVLYRIRDLIFVRAVVTHVLCGAVGSLAVTLLHFILLAAGGFTRPIPAWALTKCMGALMLGALTVPVVFHFMSGLDRRVGNFQSRKFA